MVFSIRRKFRSASKASDLWSKEQDRSIRWDDKDININWAPKRYKFF